MKDVTLINNEDIPTTLEEPTEDALVVQLDYNEDDNSYLVTYNGVLNDVLLDGSILSDTTLISLGGVTVTTNHGSITIHPSQEDDTDTTLDKANRIVDIINSLLQ